MKFEKRIMTSRLLHGFVNLYTQSSGLQITGNTSRVKYSVIHNNVRSKPEVFRFVSNINASFLPKGAQKNPGAASANSIVTLTGSLPGCSYLTIVGRLFQNCRMVGFVFELLFIVLYRIPDRHFVYVDILALAVKRDSENREKQPSAKDLHSQLT